MKNILAVFNCLVKVRYPNGEYHTEDELILMIRKNARMIW